VRARVVSLRQIDDARGLTHDLIEHHVPLVEARSRVEVSLDDLRRAVQDAVAASDEDALGEADRIHADMVRQLDQVKRLSDGAGDAGGVRTAIDAYYDLARKVALEMIAGRSVDAAATAKLVESYNEVKAALEDASARSRASRDDVLRTAEERWRAQRALRARRRNRARRPGVAGARFPLARTRRRRRPRA
jgi:hypothetical protein